MPEVDTSLPPEDRDTTLSAAQLWIVVRWMALVLGVIGGVAASGYAVGLRQAAVAESAAEAAIAACAEERERVRARALTEEEKADACARARLELVGLCGALNEVGGFMGGGE